jgi:uncharacterized protein
LPKAKELHSTLFGWQLQETPMVDGKNYTMINLGDGTGGGMMAAPDTGIPPHWLACVAVDDLAVSTKRAKHLGATMIMEDIPVADYGRFKILKDPTGAVTAIRQPTSKA